MLIFVWNNFQINHVIYLKQNCSGNKHDFD